MSDFLEELPRRAAALGRTLVFPEGDDPRVLAAAAALMRDNIAIPILLGPPASVEAGLEREGMTGPDRPRTLNPDDPQRTQLFKDRFRALPAGRAASAAVLEERARDPLVQAALMVRHGEADGAVAGCVRSTSDVLRSALRCIGPTPDIRTLSSAFYMHLTRPAASRSEVLTFTDAAVVPNPTSTQLAEIARAAVRARRLVVGDEPRVAFLSYSTRGSASGPGVARVREAFDLFRELEPTVPADGELQADAALVDAVRGQKAPESGLERSANVLVFPSLDAGNIAYKLVQRLAGATALGPILQGLAGAVNDLSRGADTRDIVLVSCITALMAAPR